MTAVLPDVAAPPAAPAPAPAPAPAARALTAVLVLAGAALVLLAGVLAVPRAGSTVVDGALALRSGPDLTTLPAYGPQGAHVLGYEHGAEVVLSVPVRNDGLLPLQVTAASLPGGERPLLDVVLDAPVDLAPGQAGALVLRGTLGNCRYWHEREVSVLGGLALTQSVLGRASERVVPLDRPVLVHSPMVVGCPDRTLDRGDDRKDGFRTFAGA